MKLKSFVIEWVTKLNALEILLEHIIEKAMMIDDAFHKKLVQVLIFSA